MAGVRVSGIPPKAEEKHIKIHFSKPQNGGGTIKKIYYPLLNNDAVIIFHDPGGKNTQHLFVYLFWSIYIINEPCHDKTCLPGFRN